MKGSTTNNGNQCPGGGIIGSVPAAAAPPPPPPPAARQFDAGRLMVPAQISKIIEASDPRKIDPALLTLVKRADPDVQVEIQILLRDASAETMAKLRQTGLDVLQPVGRDLQLIGRIATWRLEELSRIAAVRYIVKRK